MIDSGATKSSQDADGHIAPKPGTDTMILGRLASEILKAGYDDAELESACHRADIARLKKAVAEFDLGRGAAGACRPLGKRPSVAIVDEIEAGPAGGLL